MLDSREIEHIAGFETVLNAEASYEVLADYE